MDLLNWVMASVKTEELVDAKITQLNIVEKIFKASTLSPVRFSFLAIQ